MASPGNQRCADCIGTLSFPMCVNEALTESETKQTCADGKFARAEFSRHHGVRHGERHLAADLAGGKLHHQQHVVATNVLVCKTTYKKIPHSRSHRPLGLTYYQLLPAKVCLTGALPISLSLAAEKGHFLSMTLTCDLYPRPENFTV